MIWSSVNSNRKKKTEIKTRWLYCKELNSTTLSYYGLQLKRSFTNQFLLSTNGNNYHEKNCSTDYSKLKLRSKRNCLTWYHIDLRRTSAKEIHRNRVLRGREIFFFNLFIHFRTESESSLESHLCPAKFSSFRPSVTQNEMLYIQGNEVFYL